MISNSPLAVYTSVVAEVEIMLSASNEGAKHIPRAKASDYGRPNVRPCLLRCWRISSISIHVAEYKTCTASCRLVQCIKDVKHTAAGIPTWSPTVVLMYGRADGMPSFQLTVAVCALSAFVRQYILFTHCTLQSSGRDMR
jgi:hypothetical protein